MSDVHGRRMRLVRNILWAWNNDRRPPLYALMASTVGVVLTWTVAPLLGPALVILCVVYTVGWWNGHDRGYRRSTLLHLDASIRQMEEIVAAHEEEFAPHHPQRVAAAEHLAHLRALRREGGP